MHEYYSVNRFKAAYGREIEPLTDKMQWPQVELPFVVGAPLPKGEVGRRRKLSEMIPIFHEGKIHIYEL